MIKLKLQKEMIAAMKNKEALRLSTIRLIISKIKEKEINNRGEKSPNNHGELLDDDIILIMKSMIKQRKDSIAQYEKGQRGDLALKEQNEIEIISQFIPEELGEVELLSIIDTSIGEINPQGIKDLSKVIAHISGKYGSVVDMSKVVPIVKSKIS